MATDKASTGPEVALAPSGGERAVTRLMWGFILRVLSTSAEPLGGDVLRLIIFIGIVAANTAHLDVRGAETTYGDMDDAPPDAERRPISVLALSKMLGLPFETTRRHVNALIAEGRCLRLTGGLIIPSAVLESEDNTRTLISNAAAARRLVRDLSKL